MKVIGFNSGEVLICEVGVDRYREATVIGAPVNLAAKMEDVARANEIAMPVTVVPAIEQSRPEMTEYLVDRGHHHGVDVVCLDWIGYLENQRAQFPEWEIQ